MNNILKPLYATLKGSFLFAHLFLNTFILWDKGSRKNKMNCDLSDWTYVMCGNDTYLVCLSNIVSPSGCQTNLGVVNSVIIRSEYVKR